MIWDGTAKSFSDALNRVAVGCPTHEDWLMMSEVVQAAVSARELRARLERLELAAGNFIHDSDNDRKRTQNQVDALQAECAALAAKLKERGV